MEAQLGEMLEDYVERRQRGESPSAEEYRGRAGESWPDFLKLVATESTLDRALSDEADDLPRSFGRFTLLRELGRGAAGIVYEALQPDLGRTVALKILRTGFDTTPEALERFRREAVACARVRHDHIVEVYEAGHEEGRSYYVMALLAGESLSHLRKEGKVPEPRELARRLAGVADALHALHEQGIVHRDVKPGNIVMEKGGRMVLADFGLARTMYGEALTQSGEALGTPLYMSPEQLMGQRAEINGRTDVYGLGATIYRVLAGQPLFHADDFADMVRRILQERPRPLHEVEPRVPRELSRIVMKAVEKENRDRYESAAAMRDDLLAFAEGSRVEGRPLSGAERGLRAIRRRWLPLAAAAAVLAGAAWFYGTRPATLRVTSVPDADVLLDGERLGATPFGEKVKPGRRTLTLRSPGFIEHNEPVELEAGGKSNWRIFLVAKDPESPDAQSQLAKRYELVLASLDRIERDRGGADDKAIIPLLPRGPVRLSDLEKIRIDVGHLWEDTGTLEIRAGGEVLFSAPFEDPATLATVLDFPADVRAKLRDGMEFDWGFFPVKGAPVVAGCKIEEKPDAERELLRLEEEQAKQDPRLLAILKANLLLKHGLAFAAYEEAAAAGEGSRSGCAIRQQALEAMRLEGSPLWMELVADVDRLAGR